MTWRANLRCGATLRRPPQARGAAACALVCAAVGALTPAFAASHRPLPKRVSPWQRAEDERANFDDSRTHSRAAYDRVLDAYRAVYHADPADAHAAAAVNAVAELLAAEGRELEDPRALHAAVGQYEFLRAQYPASTLATAALLAEARLQATELHDPATARAQLNTLLRIAPHSASAAQARTLLAELKAPQPATAATHRAGTNVAPTMAAAPATAPPVEAEAAPVAAAVPAEAAAAQPKPVAAPEPGSGRIAQVTGIRHWSTPTYTRVAIDLGEEVKFEAARVPHPDRIYFDLHGARLAAALANKSFEVTDDGFLKRIRAGQAPGDVTRIVLDVNDVTEYSAFLLPNPYRLIIDIHGARADSAGGSAAAVQRTEVAAVPVPASAAVESNVAANHSGLPAMAPTGAADAVPQPVPGSTARNAPEPKVGVVASPTTARPVPNTVASHTTTREVAAVSDAPGRMEATSAPTSKPISSVVKPAAEPAPARSAPGLSGPARAADKTADGQTSMIRALGLRIGRIVIDAGHGGHDSGTLGVDGIEEKDVVLDVALRLGRLLHERLGAEIIYTRSDDTFIPLETRTAIANKAQADLFLSIHANSSQDATARGVETYYLNFTSDPQALDVAARENAVGGQGIHQLSDLVKKIALKDKIAESREFASDVEASLYAGLEKGNAGLKNRGVKKAPFVVLIGANMPSILAEISFVTNPRDASQLRLPEYRQRVAESLYTGVARYENGLAGARSAAPGLRAAAQ